MATTPTGLVPQSSPMATSQFDRVLSKFKKGIPQDDVHDFSFVTAEDLKQAIHRLQEEQKSEKRMQNLRRLSAFVEAMDQFDKVIQIFLNASDYLGFVWGPAKAMLLIAGTYSEALNSLLDAYQEIGEHMPLLQQYEGLIMSNPYLQEILGLVYKDILEFHHKALKHFRQRAWRKLFHASWRTFRTDFGAIISNLQSHRRLLDSQAIFVGVQETMGAMQELRETRRVVEAECQKRQKQESTNRRLAVNAWLSPADSASDHDDALAVQQGDPDSGRWLLQQDLVREWSNPNSRSEPLLWINGKPGAGKTILASILIEECRFRSNSSVAFFYCKHGDPTRDNFVGLARSIIFQLSQLQPSLLPFILDKRSDNGANTLQSPKVAREILSVAIESVADLMLVIDGLDECVKSQKDEISSWTRSEIGLASANQSNNLRCCFLSQDDNDTGRLLKSLPTFKITEQHNSLAISSFCKHRADEIGTIFALSSLEAQDLAECVSGKADGMFLYAKLVMDNLSSQISRAALKKEMKKIPPDLNQLYGRIRHRILEESSPQDRQVAKALFSWLICAKRPLKWHEIQGAMCLDLDDKMFDADRKLVRDIKHFCGSLVEVRKGGSICFVHLTAKFFLEEEPALPKHPEQLNFTRLCFSQLNLNAHDPDTPQDSIHRYVLRGEYAFTEYAMVHAFDHLHDVCLAKETVTASDFSNLVSDLRSFVARRVSAPKKRAPADRTIDNGLRVLKHEDFFNSLKHAVAFTKRSRENAKTDIDDKPVLALETQLAGVRTVMERMITASGFAPQLTPKYGENLFKCSQPQCESFHEGFPAQKTRDKHLEQHDRAFICSFPGCYWSMVGFGSLVDLQKHEQRYHQGVCDGNTFPWNGTLDTLNINQEIKTGNLPALELWLSQWEDSVPPNMLGMGAGYIRDPMHTACQHGQHEMVEAMIRKLDPSANHCSYYKTTIIAAIKERNEKTASRLLEKVTRIESREFYDLLFAALNAGLDSFSTEHLLKHAFSPLLGAIDKGRAALYLSLIVKHDRLAVLRHILETYKVDPNQQDEKGRTPLIAAAQFGRTEMASYLIETAACDKWAKNKRGETALSIAGCQGHERFISEIFPEDPPVPGVQEWLKAAQFRNAVRDGDGRKVTALLDQGLSRIDEVDLEYHSPWMWAVKKGHKEIVETLLKRSDISFLRQFPRQGKMSPEGPGVVHLAAYAGHGSVLHVLIRNDKFRSELDRSCGLFGEVAGGSRAYKTPLEIAEKRGHLNAAKVIEDVMASLDAEKAQKLAIASVQALGQQLEESLPNSQNEIQRIRPGHSLGLPENDQQAQTIFRSSPTSGGHFEPTATSLAESLGHEFLEGAFPSPNSPCSPLFYEEMSPPGSHDRDGDKAVDSSRQDSTQFSFDNRDTAASAPFAPSTEGNDRLTLPSISSFLVDMPFYDQDNIFQKMD